MKNEDWNKMFNNWKSSDKLTQLREEKRRNKTRNMDDEQLIQTIVGLIEFDSLDDEDKRALDFIEDALMFNKNKEVILIDYIQTVVGWVFHLVRQEEKENYELCSLIMRALEIEKKELYRILDTYFEFISPEDMEIIEETFNDALQTIKNK
jgi:hypothetical protein